MPAKRKPKGDKFQVGDLVVFNFGGKDNQKAGWTRLNGEIGEIVEGQKSDA